MNEGKLKNFFEGYISAATLARDLTSAQAAGSHVKYFAIEGAEGSYTVRPKHLLMVCDSVLAGDLKHEHLRTIGFCILASDYFQVPDNEAAADLISSVVNEWSAPEINLPLTDRSVRLWRSRLRRVEESR